MAFGQVSGIISVFARHRVAANLLMLAMVLVGVWALTKLNTQFLPSFDVNVITVQTVWTGASAADVERSVTIPMEQELRNLDYLKEMDSQSQSGVSLITLEFQQGTNMSDALQEVKEGVSLIRNLPEDAREPQIVKQENFEAIASVVVTGAESLQELRNLIYRLESELLDRGIARVQIVGLPEQMIAIQIPTLHLAELSVPLTTISRKIAQLSRDLPAGTIGRSSVKQQLRSLEQARSVQDFENLTLFSDQTGRLLRLGDIATIDLRPQDDEDIVTYQNQPAVQLNLQRSENSDALESAEILQQWVNDVQPSLPVGVDVHVYYESWKLINERINLLLKNGLGGLILILVLLFLFLNARVAFWVSMGIPVSFLAAIAALYFLGGSINMVSLFAMIMALGIIVDDTIVVGEESLTLYNSGKPILEAVEMGAKKMLAPVLASSLTTICAFFPLLLVGDVIGSILSAIPIVVICVIIASVIECFLVLPGHLYQSFRNLQVVHDSPVRSYIDNRFNHFRDNIFRPFVQRAIEYRYVTLSAALAAFLAVFGLVLGGHVNFTFFPSPDGTQIQAHIEFAAGTPNSIKLDFLNHVEDALKKTNQELSVDDQELVETVVSFKNRGGFDKGKGSQFASVNVELIGPDGRDVTNQEFMDAWRDNITMVPSVRSLIISAPRAGPPGQDVDIQLTGADANVLKSAAMELQGYLKLYDGVSDIEDDFPYGQQQAIFTLTPEGRAAELTIDEVGRQLRAAFTGELVQIFHEPNEEIEVRVLLPDEERYTVSVLDKLPIVTPAGAVVPLDSIVKVSYTRGFDILRHTDTRLSVHVYAKVNSKVTNTNKIISDLKKEALPSIENTFGVKYQLAGRAEEQAETLADMKYGMMLAFFMIYIILSWVFSSYGWPFLVMAAIPLGLIGAIIGHLILGHDLTILSLFGLFGLSGIIINDSIILISTFRALSEQGIPTRQAIVDASCRRLRAVLLTSLTTIAGLTPLMFETSLQAQFLIPMAISITFGLAFGTVLILVVIPAMLSVYEDCWQRADSS